MQRWLRADVLCGLMFVAFAAWGFAAGAGLETGSSLEMGPGYFPRLVSGILLVLGLAIAASGLRAADGAAVGGWAVRPITLVSLAALAFAILLERAGIVIAIVTVIAIGAFAGSRIEPRSLAALAVLLVAASIGLFVLAIGIPLPIWPRLG